MVNDSNQDGHNQQGGYNGQDGTNDHGGYLEEGSLGLAGSDGVPLRAGRWSREGEGPKHPNWVTF